jgi:hypothetical protein
VPCPFLPTEALSSTSRAVTMSPITSRYVKCLLSFDAAHSQVQLLVRAYQVRGHHIANLDPLRILSADLDANVPPELKLDYYGWTEEDLKKEFSLSTAILPRFMGTVPGDKMTLGEIIHELKTMYCESGPPIVVCRANIQATTSVSSTSTLPTENSVIGFESESRSPHSGSTRQRKSE